MSMKDHYLATQRKEAALEILACVRCGAQSSYLCICNNQYSYGGKTYHDLEIMSEIQPSILQEEDIRMMMLGDLLTIDGKTLTRVK